MLQPCSTGTIYGNRISVNDLGAVVVGTICGVTEPGDQILCERNYEIMNTQQDSYTVQ